MSKKQAEELSNDVLIADALVRLSTLENLLIEKGVFTREEFNKATSVAATNLVKVILQRANVPGDLDAIVKSLQEKNSTGN
jgi:hypothetical protein